MDPATAAASLERGAHPTEWWLSCITQGRMKLAPLKTVTIGWNSISDSPVLAFVGSDSNEGKVSDQTPDKEKPAMGERA